jgi:hypothetical protein
MADSPAAAVRVIPLLFGQEWTDPNGTVMVAEHDAVLLQLLQDDEPVATLLQTPTSAIGLARLLTTAAGSIMAAQVDDDGRKPSALDRLARFNDAWKGKA